MEAEGSQKWGAAIADGEGDVILILMRRNDWEAE